MKVETVAELMSFFESAGFIGLVDFDPSYRTKENSAHTTIVNAILR
jgi:hypothetical protein